MEKLRLDNDINIFCVSAESFPDGIIAAFQKLEQLHPSIGDRPFYGLSKENKGTISYKAAVEEAYDGEGKKYGCEVFTIKKGNYMAITIMDYMRDIKIIPNAFRELTAHLLFDRSFPCVEWYKNAKEVTCMVRLKH